MPSSITLGQTINYTQTFVRLQPLTGVGGVDTEPACSIANAVKQFILSPPFGWSWNRATKTFSTIAGQQDYVVSLSDFSWIEQASITDSYGNTFTIPVKLSLPDSSEQGRPSLIAAQMDDGSGNITFRLSSVPDAVYSVKITYQKAATLFTDTTSTWGIPDQLAYIYNSGFLAYALEMVDDARFSAQLDLFLRQLVSACSGLEDTQKNLFLEGRMQDSKQMNGRR